MVHLKVTMQAAADTAPRLVAALRTLMGAVRLEPGFAACNGWTTDSAHDGVAVRCWPEMFTEYGCAACGPMAMMNQKQVPSACEADVHGSLSQRMLQGLAWERARLADAGCGKWLMGFISETELLGLSSASLDARLTGGGFSFVGELAPQ